MSETRKSAPQKPRRDRSAEARAAARRGRAERERSILSLLNGGVSIAEIAARRGLTERRVRMLVQDILDKRAPRAPAEFAALQISRLHEALVVAYGAMADGNLDAIDRVVTVVRELDRYHGLAAPDLGRDGGTAVGSPRPRKFRSRSPRRKEKPSQTLEIAQFAEGNGSPRAPFSRRFWRK